MTTQQSTCVVYRPEGGLPGPKDEDYHSEPDDKSEDDVPKRKKPRTGSKTKAADSSGPSDFGHAPAHRRQRGTRGLLKGVMDMPFDVGLEIFGKLSPGDLLHLAQTSKDLRVTLMSRSSASTWKEARQNEPELPDCPPDLSEPQYANLCFGKYCMHCMRSKVSVTYTLWSGRIRLCRACIETECQTYYPHDRHIYSIDVLTLLPSVFVKKQGRSYRRGDYYLKSAVDDWVKRTEDKSAEERLAVQNEFQARHEHGTKCKNWFSKRLEALSDQKASIIDERRGLIIAHARSLGWNDEFEFSDSALQALKRSDIIRKACGKNVTGKVLMNLEDTLNKILSPIRVKREADAAEALLKKRLPVYKEAFKQHLATLSAIEPYPTPRQLFDTPLVRGIVIQTPATHELTVNDFKPLFDDFSTFVDEWKARVTSDLKDMIKKARWTDSLTNEENVLDLATTFFMCKMCSGTTEPISYPRVLSHGCIYALSLGGQSSLFAAHGAEDRVLRSILGEALWNQHGCLSFNAYLSRFVGDIIEMCGFNRHTTTKVEIDAANPILECLSCHSNVEGRVVMTWWTIIQHWSTKHLNKYQMGNDHGHPPTMKLRLVNDPIDADRIRAELAIQREKDEARIPSSICAQCHHKATRPQCKEHWKTEHGRPAQQGDILPQLDHGGFNKDYYCWPPWEDEEFALLRTDITVIEGGGSASARKW